LTWAYVSIDLLNLADELVTFELQLFGAFGLLNIGVYVLNGSNYTMYVFCGSVIQIYKYLKTVSQVIKTFPQFLTLAQQFTNMK